MSTSPRSRRPALRGWLVAGLAVAVVVGLVAAFGGFGPRKVASLTAQPGTEIDAHNLVFRLDSATVQYIRGNTSKPWRLVVSGSVRNPTEETLYPKTGSLGNLIAIAEGAQPVRTGNFSAKIGPADPERTFNPRWVIPPNNAWMSLTASYEFEKFWGVDSVQIAVVPMEFTANVILGLSDVPEWNVASYELPTSVYLPVTRLPDVDY
ncbi:MAG: hypothetical protein QM804_16325 [Propionicimonas sp.]